MVGLMSSISAAPPAAEYLAGAGLQRGQNVGALVGAHFDGGQRQPGALSAFTRAEPGAGCAPDASGRSMRSRPFCARIAARSITFCSSRTLPGQS